MDNNIASSEFEIDGSNLNGYLKIYTPSTDLTFDEWCSSTEPAVSTFSDSVSGRSKSGIFYPNLPIALYLSLPSCISIFPDTSFSLKDFNAPVEEIGRPLIISNFLSVFFSPKMSAEKLCRSPIITQMWEYIPDFDNWFEMESTVLPIGNRQFWLSVSTFEQNWVTPTTVDIRRMSQLEHSLQVKNHIHRITESKSLKLSVSFLIHCQLVPSSSTSDPDDLESSLDLPIQFTISHPLENYFLNDNALSANSRRTDEELTLDDQEWHHSQSFGEEEVDWGEVDNDDLNLEMDRAKVDPNVLEALAVKLRRSVRGLTLDHRVDDEAKDGNEEFKDIILRWNTYERKPLTYETDVFEIWRNMGAKFRRFKKVKRKRASSQCKPVGYHVVEHCPWRKQAQTMREKWSTRNLYEI